MGPGLIFQRVRERTHNSLNKKTDIKQQNTGKN